MPYFPSFVLLINIFIPIFIYLLIRSSFYYIKFVYLKITKSPTKSILRKKDDFKKKMDKETKKESTEKKTFWEKVKNRGIMLIGFIGIFLIFGLFQEPIKQYFSIDISSWQMIIFAALIIFSGPLSKIFQKPLTFRIIIAIIIIVLSYGFISSPGSTWQILYQSIQMMVIFMIILGLFGKLIGFYTLKTSLEKIKIENLKPGMNLAEEIINKLKKDKKYYNKHIGHIYPEGLTLKQVEAVKKWLKQDKKEKMLTIDIYKPFPFVIWMFIGLIITLLLKGSLLYLFLGAK